MKRLVIGSLAVMLALAMAAPVQAAEGQSFWSQLKNDFKDAGRNIGKKGKEIGLGVADGAKKGGKDVKEAFTPDKGGKGNGK